MKNAKVWAVSLWSWCAHIFKCINLEIHEDTGLIAEVEDITKTFTIERFEKTLSQQQVAFVKKLDNAEGDCFILNGCTKTLQQQRKNPLMNSP